MRSNISQLRSELVRWALMTVVAMGVVAWVSLVVGVGWSIRIAKSTRLLLVTAPPVGAVEASGIPSLRK
mgnify:CR=1 FL=1